MYMNDGEDAEQKKTLVSQPRNQQKDAYTTLPQYLWQNTHGAKDEKFIQSLFCRLKMQAVVANRNEIHPQ